MRRGSPLRIPPSRFLLRAPMAADAGFVTDAWLRGYRRSDAVRGVDPVVFDHHVRSFIQARWRDRGTTWLVAGSPEDSTFAFGFLCGEATDIGIILHWLYVKRDDRGFGIAGAMLEAFEGGARGVGKFYTASTRPFERMLAASGRFKKSDYIYDPWLAYEAPWRQ